MSQQYIIPTPGDVVAGKFRIERELGRGSYGVVFRAHQEGIGRDVALKTLLPKGFLDEEIVERFEREAHFVGRLSHPNIVEVYDSGRHENLLYMAVEYVEGPTLDEIIDEEGPLDPERAFRLLDQLIDALAHAHERGIVHRDLKPANIVVVTRRDSEGNEREQIKVLDFGIAKLVRPDSDQEQATLTQAGAVLGTPHYMSPETIAGDSLDHRADLYALGIIIYEVLTGERPFEAKTSAGVMVDHLRSAPPPLPDKLERTGWGQVVRGCLRKDPDERFQSALEVRRALERRDEPVVDANKSRQRRAVVAAIAVGVLAALAIVGGYQIFTDEPDRTTPASAGHETSDDDSALATDTPKRDGGSDASGTSDADGGAASTSESDAGDTGGADAGGADAATPDASPSEPEANSTEDTPPDDESPRAKPAAAGDDEDPKRADAGPARADAEGAARADAGNETDEETEQVRLR
ncbi:MAG: protein kinase domain-containing protein, partial [Persicimonas sp.]